MLPCRRRPGAAGSRSDSAGSDLDHRGRDLILLVLGLELAEGVEARQAVDEEDPVEMVELVLVGAGREAGRLDADLLAVAGAGPYRPAPVAGPPPPPPPGAQASPV